MASIVLTDKNKQSVRDLNSETITTGASTVNYTSSLYTLDPATIRDATNGKDFNIHDDLDYIVAVIKVVGTMPAGTQIVVTPYSDVFGAYADYTKTLEAVTNDTIVVAISDESIAVADKNKIVYKFKQDGVATYDVTVETVAKKKGVTEAIDSALEEIYDVFEATQDPTGFNAEIAASLPDIALDETTRTITLSVKSGSQNWYFYENGVKYTKTVSESVIFPDTTNLKIVYYNGSTLTVIDNPTVVQKVDVLRERTIVCFVYWNATVGSAVYFSGSNEFHSIQMDGNTHAYLHTTQKTRYLSGLALGNFTIDGTGDEDSNNNLSCADGYIQDEDITVAILDGAPQDLSTVLKAPIWYKSGASGAWNCDCVPADWEDSTVYSPGDKVKALTGNAAARCLIFQCSVGGTSGGSEPTWQDAVGGVDADGGDPVGASTTDNTVTWICVGAYNSLVKNYVGGSYRPAWNQYTGGSWQQTEVANTEFVLAHIVATNDSRYPIIIAQGQATYNNIVNARLGANDEIFVLQQDSIPFEEFIFVGTVIMQAGTGYANNGKARTRTADGGNYVDFTSASKQGVVLAIGDHGTLSGLGDDDHPQYALLTGRSGGQIIYGGTDSGDDLTIYSTSHATPGDIILKHNTTIEGNLDVTGTTTETVTLLVEDKNIEMGVVASPSDSTADGGGIILKGTTDKTILWENEKDTWNFNNKISTPNGHIENIILKNQEETTYEQKSYKTHDYYWTARTSAVDNDWQSVCWSPRLGLYCAVSNAGTNDRVMTSPDGINWTARTPAQVLAWESICWSPKLSLFITVSSSGSGYRVMTSTNGVNWSIRASAADNSWKSVCWCLGLDLLVAVASSGTGNRVMTSSDGINWTARTSAVDNDWQSVCWSTKLNLLVAVASSGTGNRVMTSPDGINWTARTSAQDLNWQSVCWSPELNLFVAVASTAAGTSVMTSPDGITWTSRTSAAANSWQSVCWSPELNILIAVASSGTGNRIMTSPNGINWTIRTSAVDNNWQSICYSPEIGRFCVVASSGTGNRVMSSEILSNIGCVNILGAQFSKITTVNAATYDLLQSDYILNVTYTSTGAVTSLTLPTAQTIEGRIIHIKDSGGNAGANNITIDTEGGENIDGAGTYVISTNYDKVTLYCDGSNWFSF